MPPSTTLKWRTGNVLGLLVSSIAALAAPTSAQELILRRDYPGSGPYECPAPGIISEPAPDDAARARQLASDANAQLILGDLERVETLLAQAIALDPSSADFAYRRGGVLEELGFPERAMVEYCRAIDLDIAAEGIPATGVRADIDLLWNQIRARLPEPARAAFAGALAAADDSLYLEAIESFTVAVDLAPEWATPLYNRGLLNEFMGNDRAAVADFRAYLLLVADPEAADALAISERLGALEGAASVVTPNPMGALALGALPGMGYYYTRQPIPGTITLVAAGASLAAGLLLRERTTVCLAVVPSDGTCPSADIVDQFTDRPYMLYGIGAAAAVTIAGAYDAWRRAKQARAQAEEITGPFAPPSIEAGFPEISAYRDQIDLSFLRVRFR